MGFGPKSSSREIVSVSFVHTLSFLAVTAAARLLEPSSELKN